MFDKLLEQLSEIPFHRSTYCRTLQSSAMLTNQFLKGGRTRFRWVDGLDGKTYGYVLENTLTLPTKKSMIFAEDNPCYVME